MRLDPLDVTRGIEVGLIRAKNRFGPRAEPTSATQIRNQVARAFEDWPEQLSSPFVQLVAELVTTASIARAWNEEPPLRDDEVLAFLAHASSFLNSFKHK